MGFLLGVVYDARPRPRMTAYHAPVDGGVSESTGAPAASVQPVILDPAVSLDQPPASAELASMEEGAVSGSREVAEPPAPGFGRPLEREEESVGGKPASRQWSQGTEAAKQTSIRKGTAVAVKYSVGVPTDAMNVEANSKLVGLSEPGSAAPPPPDSNSEIAACLPVGPTHDAPLGDASAPSLVEPFPGRAQSAAASTIAAPEASATRPSAESVGESPELTVGAIVGGTTAMSSAAAPPDRDVAVRSERTRADDVRAVADAARAVSTIDGQSSIAASGTIRDQSETNPSVVNARPQRTQSASAERAPRAASTDQSGTDHRRPATSSSPGTPRDATARRGRPGAPRPTAVEPTVHIGHVEIVVMPPAPPARSTPTPSRPSSLASRLYLRNF